MTYYINVETTGLDKNEQVKHMAELLRGKGYDVEFTSNFGDINPGTESQFEGGKALSDWEDALVAASNV